MILDASDDGGEIILNVDSLRPLGSAILDYFNGDTDAKALFIREDGERSELNAGTFFGEPEASGAIDKMSLSLCKGRVLDVGAGTGRHSITLKRRGFSVCAIDILPEAVQIIRSRGIAEVYCIDILNFDMGGYDTILMLGHGLGISQDLRGLNYLLDRLGKLLSNGGIILCDSLDVRADDKPENLAYRKSIEKNGRYMGEVRFQIEYGGERGPFVNWLHIDPDTLARYASANGFECEVMLKEDNGDYLAGLRQADSSV